MRCFQNQLFCRYASRPFFKAVMICDDMSTKTERFVKTQGLLFLLTHSSNVEEALLYNPSRIFSLSSSKCKGPCCSVAFLDICVSDANHIK